MCVFQVFLVTCLTLAMTWLDLTCLIFITVTWDLLETWRLRLETRLWLERMWLTPTSGNCYHCVSHPSFHPSHFHHSVADNAPDTLSCSFLLGSHKPWSCLFILDMLKKRNDAYKEKQETKTNKQDTTCVMYNFLLTSHSGWEAPVVGRCHTSRESDKVFISLLLK